MSLRKIGASRIHTVSGEVIENGIIILDQNNTIVGIEDQAEHGLDGV